MSCAPGRLLRQIRLAIRIDLKALSHQIQAGSKLSERRYSYTFSPVRFIPSFTASLQVFPGIKKSAMANASSISKTDFDVIIIGAGISGINAEYRVLEALPDYSYAVLKARHEIGST